MTKFKFNSKNAVPEKNDGKSIFVPGMSIKLSDLLLKINQGVAPAVQNEGEYAENPEFDDLIIHNGMDLTELAEIQSMLNVALAIQNENLKKAEAKKVKDAFDIEVKKQTEIKLAELEKSKSAKAND